MPRLWAVIKMRCNESTIYIYPQFKRQYFLQTIENSNLLTNFTTDFTNLSLKLKLIIDRDARSSISSWIGITVPSQDNTGFLSTLPKVIAWYFEWFLLIWLNSYHSSTFFRSAFMACSTWSISSADLNNWVPALFHIFTHWNCFLSSVATNGKNGYRLNPTL